MGINKLATLLTIVSVLALCGCGALSSPVLERMGEYIPNNELETKQAQLGKAKTIGRLLKILDISKYPFGEEDTILTYDEFIPSIEYRGMDANHRKVQYHIQQLERIPDQIQRIVHERGGSIVFFNGPLAKQPEIKGKLLIDQSRRNNVPYAYLELQKTVMVGIEGDYGPGTAITHEFGHAMDNLIGKEIFGINISKTEIISKLIKKYHSRLDYYYHRPHEYVANMITDYYTSEDTRDIMKKRYRAAYDFVRIMEIIISRGYLEPQ
jgi:hypothetical protein